MVTGQHCYVLLAVESHRLPTQRTKLFPAQLGYQKVKFSPEMWGFLLSAAPPTTLLTVSNRLMVISIHCTFLLQYFSYIQKHILQSSNFCYCYLASQVWSQLTTIKTKWFVVHPSLDIMPTAIHYISGDRKGICPKVLQATLWVAICKLWYNMMKNLAFK